METYKAEMFGNHLSCDVKSLEFEVPIQMVDRFEPFATVLV